MRVRPLNATDIPAIRQMFLDGGLAYDFPDVSGPRMEAVLVVEDDTGNVLAAVGAERILQLYFWTTQFAPAAKLHAIRLLHQALPPILMQKGYTEVNAFVPPQMEKSFGRRLTHMFNWTRNWPSFAKQLGAGG